MCDQPKQPSISELNERFEKTGKQLDVLHVSKDVCVARLISWT